MPTGDARSSGHLVLSHFGTCMCSNVETNLSWTCLVSGLLNFEHPSVLLFCLLFWINYLSVTWYPTCGAYIFKDFAKASYTTYLYSCKGLIINVYTYPFFTWPYPSSLSQPFSAPRICAWTICETALSLTASNVSPSYLHRVPLCTTL